ncbi:unnamed protein product [Blepharisma stoltei]|uniref:Phosphodiesterase n=1 Tax=Blepharisma stoltei TaxID=1481888 RepID=A0AAU9J9I1_9CILI|nr:unnamed protein product [Blepharisma stoltei]
MNPQNPKRNLSDFNEAELEEKALILVPAGVGDLLYHCAKQISKIFQLDAISPIDLEPSIKSTCKALTSSSRVEVFIKEKSRLKFSGNKENFEFLEINSKNLPGFVADTNLYQIINDPQKSSFYASFTENWLPGRDWINSDENLQSICAVPISNADKTEVYGVVVLCNKIDPLGLITNFTSNDALIVQSVGMMVFELVNSRKKENQVSDELIISNNEKDQLSKSHRHRRPNPITIEHDNFNIKISDPPQSDWKTIVKEGEKNKLLQQWCKQVFAVSNFAQSNHLLAKNILQRLATENGVDILVISSLEIIKALIYCEGVNGYYKNDGVIYEYSIAQGKTSCSLSAEMQALYENSIKTGKALMFVKEYGRENMMMVPYVSNENAFVIEVWNKKDETWTFFSNFTKEDKNIIGEVARVVFKALKSDKNEKSHDVTKLRHLIRHHATSINTYSIISTIRDASQKLLDCDRATVYIREGNSLVVKVQGSEQEIPTNFEVPLGKGIAGYVAQTGLTEIICDAYQDFRFNHEIDDLTGYRTHDILCMPVLDCNGETIAVLQMLNKNEGIFDQNDEDILEIFAELVGVVLQGWKLFDKNIEERTRLINILNSLGNYILVVDGSGKLYYNNRSFEEILGITEATAKNSSYISWLKHNRQLVLDINAIFQNPKKKIYKKSQRLIKNPHKYHVGSGEELIIAGEDSLPFNYTLVPLQDFITLETSGVVIILEDATAIEELNSKLAAMQNQLDVLTSSVQAETSLQKCIQKLSIISQDFDHNSDTYLQVIDVINTLKQGNLNRTEIKIPIDMHSKGNELISIINEYTDTSEQGGLRSPVIRERKYSGDKDGELASELEELRNWNLNAFDISCHLIYIKAMLQNFDLINIFDIKHARLANFVSKVEENYQTYTNPYHNFYHGFTVMHSSYYLLSATAAGLVFKTQEIYAQLIAALCHDIGHTGHTNNFEINRASQYAITYNDKSVLENHHSALTFHILQNDSCNILEGVPTNMLKGVRKLMIRCILDTDMAIHFNMISNMSNRFKDLNERPLGSIDDDCEKTAAFIIHVADLAHSAKNNQTYTMWSKLVCEEFYKQYREEVANCLPLTEHMKDINQPLIYYKNEIGFLKVVAKPLWDCVGLWLSPEINFCIENVNENIKNYEKNLEELSKKE